MPSIRSLVNKGRPFRGRDLQRALLAAARPPVGGGGVVSTTREAEAVLTKTGTHPIPRLPLLFVQFRINPTVLLIDDNGNPARWEYGWDEVWEVSPGTWQFKPNGKTSDDTGRSKALNYAEQLNTSSTVARGIAVAQPEIEVQVLPVPPGQVIQCAETKRGDGTFGYWFEAYNGLNVTCTGAAAAGGLAPPTAIRKYLERTRPDGKMPPEGWSAYSAKR